MSDKNNVIQFPNKSEAKQDTFPEMHIPLPSEVAYYTNNLISYEHTPAAIRAYTQRQDANEATWLDYVTVLLGVPSYVETVSQLEELDIPALECPLGLLTDLAFVTNVSFNVAVQWEDEDDVMHLLHVSFEEFEFMARVKANALNGLFDQSEIHDRKQFIVTLFLEREKQDHKDTMLNAILAIASTEGSTYPNMYALDLIQLYEWATETFDVESYFNSFADFYNSVISLVDTHPVDLKHDQRIIYANETVGRTSNDDLVAMVEGELEELEG
jgi:hypothetical protein